MDETFKLLKESEIEYFIRERRFAEEPEQISML